MRAVKSRAGTKATAAGTERARGAAKNRRVAEMQTGVHAGVEVGAGVGEVGRLVDSSQADDRRVIRLVSERPLLYARNNMPVASYYSQVKKLWKEVADEMGWTGLFCSTKFLYIIIRYLWISFGENLS